MDVGVEVCAERPEGLNRGDAAWSHVLAFERGLEGLEQSVVGAAGEDCEELSLALEEAA